MTTPPLPEGLSKEAFVRFAREVGLPDDSAHLEALHAEVRGMLRAITPLATIDTTGVPLDVPLTEERA